MQTFFNPPWIRVPSPSLSGFRVLCIVFAVLAAVLGISGQYGLALMAFAAACAAAGYAFVSQTYVAIDRNAVQFYAPLRGQYKIVWSDVRYVLTNRETYAFIGADKALSVKLFGELPAYESMRVAINDLTRARGVPVMQTREEPSIKTHNTKIVS
jgi:hypothetical protein